MKRVILVTLACLLTSGVAFAQLPYRIGVDAGHGGTEPGAVGGGLSEKNVNLATALALKKYLENDGATVYMTRTSDTTVSLQSRTNYFISNGVARAISVHHNSGGAAKRTMDFVYCGRCAATAATLASQSIQRLGTSTGLTIGPPASTSNVLCSSGTWSCPLQGVGEANLHMVREPEVSSSHISSVLVEVSFISDPQEQVKLANSAYLDGNGWAIYAGVADHYHVSPKPIGGTTASAASMLTPANGSTFTSSSMTFRWDAGTLIQEYFLYVGTSPGDNDLYEQSQGTNRSATVSGLPTDGRAVFVRLWSRTGSTWLARDYAYTAWRASPVCSSFSISPSSASVTATAGSRTATITGAPSGCTGGSWTTSGNGSWLSVTPASGAGSGSATVSWTQNSSTSSRSGNATIAGRTFAVTQAAAPSPVAELTMSSLPTTGSVGQPLSFTVTGRNTGGAAAWGGLSVSFPDLVGEASSSSCPDKTDTTYDNEAALAGQSSALTVSFYRRLCTISSGGAQYLLVEGWRSTAAGGDWPGGGSYSMTITVTPRRVGTLRIYTRLALCPATSCSSGVARAPAQGTTAQSDQQGLSVNVLTINVAPLACTAFSISPSSENPAAGAGSRTVTVTGSPSGCAGGSWSANGNGSWLTVSPTNGTGSGTATVSWTQNTSTASRSGNASIAGRTFAVTQGGAPAAPVCTTFSISPSSTNPAFNAGSQNVAITASPSGCAGGSWSAIGNGSWLTVSPSSGSGPGTATVSWTQNTLTSSRLGNATIAGRLFAVTQAGRRDSRPGDFDGDGKAEPAVYRPATGNWFIHGQSNAQWGATGDIPVPADYDGDGRTDAAVYRPSTGQWFVRGQTTTQWGRAGDVPVPGDFDGDGKTEAAVFRMTDGVFATWHINGRAPRGWGLRGDIAVPGDFDGDGKTDLAVYRPGPGVWYILESSANFTTHRTAQFGLPGDVPLSADFDGDARTDLAVFRPSTGMWYLSMSTAGFLAVQFGLPGDVPVPLDVDGDHKPELIVWRPRTGTWFIFNRTSGAVSTQALGTTGDIPVMQRPQLPASPTADFDGDGRADITTYTVAGGASYWYHRFSRAGYTTNAVTQWGLAGDVKVPGDYDGDHKTDAAVFRPSNGVWYLTHSASGTTRQVQWGVSGDTPVPGDYDGDGRTDPAVFRPAGGYWFVLLSSTDYTQSMVDRWGDVGDVPQVGDFDGDGRTDFAVFRPSTGVWLLKMTTTWYSADRTLVWPFGTATDKPVAADYDGDGRTDLGLYRGHGNWLSADALSNQPSPARQLGLSGDIPSAHDYDGDGRIDMAVFRPSSGQWFVAQSSNGLLLVFQWGVNGDMPVSRAAGIYLDTTSYLKKWPARRRRERAPRESV